MAQFRKKPVVIEAAPFQWGMEDGIMRYHEHIERDAATYPEDMRSTQHDGYLSRYDDILDGKGFAADQWAPFIETSEGPLRISEGDCIITGVKGERYPCKPDIFAATYEPA